MNIRNKKCVSIINSISGNVTYNGKTINIPRGSRFEITDGSFLINGKPIEQYNEANEKQQYNDTLVQGLQQVQNLTDALATYPNVDSVLMAKIGAAGGEQVSMVLTGYDASTGALQFEAQSSSVIDIPSYVLKLQKTGLFQKVDYTGYAYDEGVYVLSLNCILQSGGEEAAK